jgi:hypothetical protein
MRRHAGRWWPSGRAAQPGSLVRAADRWPDLRNVAEAGCLRAGHSDGRMGHLTGRTVTTLDGHRADGHILAAASIVSCRSAQNRAKYPFTG